MEKILHLTESGDRYLATQEDWDRYREAVERNDWVKVQWFEEGNASFEYSR